MNNMFEWKTLQDGGSYTWLYSKEIDGAWLFIEITDMVDACGRDAQYLYYAELSAVLPDEVGIEDTTRALQSVGFEGLGIDLDLTPAILAEVLHEYGCKAPLWSAEAVPLPEDVDAVDWPEPDEDSDEFKSLLSDALREAEAAATDLETRLDSGTVNKIGQTPREFMSGTEGLWDALRRIQNDPEATAEQKIILKMYGACESTLSGSTIPSDIKGGS